MPSTGHGLSRTDPLPPGLFPCPAAVPGPSWDARSEASFTRVDRPTLLVSLVDRGPVRASAVHPAVVERSAPEVNLAAWAPQKRQLVGAHTALVVAFEDVLSPRDSAEEHVA